MYCPGAQPAVQAVLALAAAKEPCWQGVHCEEAGALAMEPKFVSEEAPTQGEGAAAPGGQALPAGQTAHATEPAGAK